VQRKELESKIKILELDLKIEKLEIQIAATTDPVQRKELESKIKILELDLKIEKLEIQIAATTDPVQRKELEIKLEQAATARDEVLQKLFETELQELRQQQRLITQGAQRHPSVHSLRTFSLVNHH